MTTESGETEIVEEVPKERAGYVLVVALSVSLGIVLSAGVIGLFLYHQSGKALRAEVLAMKKEIKEKSSALEGMKLQIESLSSQMHVLKEYAIAHSSSASVTEKPAENVDKTSESAAGEVAQPKAEKKDKTSDARGAPRATKTPTKPGAQNCDLVGKSPEEQAAILKRCVSLIDPPVEKP